MSSSRAIWNWWTDALQGDRLIGMIQPIESEETVLKPKLSQVGCAGKIISFRETEDNRYLITLAGLAASG